MLGQLLDNLIAPFAPLTAMRRTLIRAQLRTYQAADKGRRNRDWQASNRSADSAIIPDANVLNARARQMIRDSHIAQAISFAKVRNIVGRGITPIPVATDAAGNELKSLNVAAEKRFWAWSNDPKKCDVEGRRTFWQFQQLAVSEKVAVGEVFIVWSYTPGVGFQLQAYEAEQLDETLQTCGNNEVRGGVEVDISGKSIAYHFYLRNPNDLLFRKTLKSVRITADRVYHFYRPTRVLQTRGVSELAPVLQRIRDVNRRDDAELMVSIMEACMGMSITRNQPVAFGADGVGRESGGSTTTLGGMEKFDFAPGMVFRGQPGEEVKFHAPTRPGNSFEPYQRVNLRGIAAGADLSYEQITRDFSAGSWSTQRASLLEDRRSWNAEQDLLTDLFVSPAYEDWFRFEVVDGHLPLAFETYAVDPERYHEAEYAPDGHEWVDPEKELNGVEKELNLRLGTRKNHIGRRGGRYSKVFQQISAERLEAAKLGIVFPEDADLAATAAKAPPAPAPAAPAPVVAAPAEPPPIQ
jgi:lambda family phage portal protein